MRNCSPFVSFCVVLGLGSASAFAGQETEKINTETKSKPIKAQIRYQFDRNLRPGAIRKV